MTEITKNTESLPPSVAEFILRWGDLGGQWGVNRSVAQIHALLYVSETPMTAEDIASALDMARSNVSNSIKELLGWRLIFRVPIMGDRRDHYACETDIWEMVTRIAEGRKAREIDPAQTALNKCVEQAQSDPHISAAARARLEAMLDFVNTMSRWHDQMMRVPKPALMRLIKMGDSVTRFLGRGK
jgi:DNA-binding transcriptional regulator GbsR (MarR family)